MGFLPQNGNVRSESDDNPRDGVEYPISVNPILKRREFLALYVELQDGMMAYYDVDSLQTLVTKDLIDWLFKVERETIGL